MYIYILYKNKYGWSWITLFKIKKKENCEFSLCFTITIAPWPFLGCFYRRYRRSTMTKKFSKAAKNQVLWFSNAKQSYSAFFVSILMYSNKVPRTFFNTWKLRLFSWSNSSILRNKEKVRHIKKLPIFWNSKICMDYNAKHHKKSEKTQN